MQGQAVLISLQERKLERVRHLNRSACLRPAREDRLLGSVAQVVRAHA